MILYNSCPCCGRRNIAPVLTSEDYTVSHEQFQIWECSNCTLRFTQNAPAAAEITSYYQSENYISHSDINKGLINRLYHKVRIRTLRRKRKLVENETGKITGNILDVGCGTGAFLYAMGRAGWQVTGVEPDERARNKAFGLYGLHLSDSAGLFSLPPGSFDAITLWHVLEHVHELHSYIKCLKELLRPGGRLFIAVPNYTCYDAHVYKRYWAAYDVPRHLYHFSPASMDTLLSLHQMKLISAKTMWYDSFYISMLSEKYKTGKNHLIRAFITGMISNCNAMSDRKKSSSIIYITSVSPLPNEAQTNL